MNCGRKIGPFDCCSVVEDDVFFLLGSLPDNCADLLFLDPPFGIGKAGWDADFLLPEPKELLRIAPTVTVTPGGWNLARCIAAFGSDFRGLLAARNLNGMAHGPLGFSNYIPVVLAGKVSRGVDAFDFAVLGKKPEHPSPKPIEFMRAVLQRFTEPGATVLDLFGGSGTTGVAAAELGRHFLLFEFEPQYVELARTRIEHAAAQAKIF